MNGQKQMNDNISEKFLANDKILESLAMQLDGFNSVIKHQLSFNKLIETKVTQLASTCLNHDTGKLSGQPEVTPKESVNAVAVWKPSWSSRAIGPQLVRHLIFHRPPLAQWGIGSAVKMISIVVSLWCRVVDFQHPKLSSIVGVYSLRPMKSATLCLEKIP